MLTDSTTAAARFFSLRLPEYDIKHLCSKGRRFLSWADKIAYSASWPMVTAHVQGELNCLARMLSHIGDILSLMGKGKAFGMTAAQATAQLTAQRESEGTICHMTNSIVAIAGVMPVSLHSYHGKRPVLSDSRYMDPPNFETRHLKQPNDADVETIAAAYKTDEQPFQKIDLKTVYAVATGELTGISRLQQEKVREVV